MLNNNILVVEDEPLILQAINKKLTKHGYSPILCEEGFKALSYLDTHTETPAAIWLDYYLPDLNGLELLTRIKKNPSWAKIPVMVVSNSASDEKVDAMLKLGANKYLLKADHKLEDVINILGNLIAENATPVAA
jgi:DNA-binding response OmpR family regulator